MKLIKTLTAVAAAVCCLTVTSQASFVPVSGFGPGTAAMTSSADSGATQISVDYEVLQDTSTLTYYYLYQITPSANSSGVEDFAVSMNTVFSSPVVLSSSFISGTLHVTDIVAGGTTDTNWLPGGSSSALNVNWNNSLFPHQILMPGDQSIVLGFSSLIQPTWGNGQAQDSVPPSPWSTFAAGTLIPVPVPEPTTMIAGALLLLPFGASTLRIVRRRMA